ADAQGASLTTDVARALTDRASREAVLARWDAATIVILTEGTEPSSVRALVEDLLTAARGAGAPAIRAGVSAVSDGEALHDVMARAVQRQLLASAEWPVNSRDDATRPPNPVLLAEDDPVVATLVVERLRRAGLEVVHCATGTDAVELLTTKSFSCAI